MNMVKEPQMSTINRHLPFHMTTLVVMKMWCLVGNSDTRVVHLAAFLKCKIRYSNHGKTNNCSCYLPLGNFNEFCLILKSVLSARWTVSHYLPHCQVPSRAGEAAQVARTASKKRMQSGILHVTGVAPSQDALMVIYYFIKGHPLPFCLYFRNLWTHCVL